MTRQAAAPRRKQRPVFLVPTGLPGNDYALDQDIPALGAPVWGFTDGSKPSIKDMGGGSILLMSSPGTGLYNRLAEVDRVIYDRRDLGRSLWGSGLRNDTMGGRKRTGKPFTVIVTLRKVVKIDFSKERVKKVFGYCKPRDKVMNTRRVKADQKQRQAFVSKCCKKLGVPASEWSEQPQRPLPPAFPQVILPSPPVGGAEEESRPGASEDRGTRGSPDVVAERNRAQIDWEASEKAFGSNGLLGDVDILPQSRKLKGESKSDASNSAEDDGDVIVILDSDDELEEHDVSGAARGGAPAIMDSDAELEDDKGKAAGGGRVPVILDSDEELDEHVEGDTGGHTGGDVVDDADAVAGLPATPTKKADSSGVAPSLGAMPPGTAPGQDLTTRHRRPSSSLPAMKLEGKLGDVLEAGPAQGPRPGGSKTEPAASAGSDGDDDGGAWDQHAEHGATASGAAPVPAAAPAASGRAPVNMDPLFQPVFRPDEHKLAFRVQGVLAAKPDPSPGGSRLWLVRRATGQQPASADTWVGQGDLAQDCPQLLISALSELLAVHEKRAEARAAAEHAKADDGQQEGSLKRPLGDGHRVLERKLKRKRGP